jgi:enterochelin esterase-like enzyme
MDAIWQIVIIGGPVPWIVFALAVLFALYLILRRPTARWIVTVLLGLLVGAAVGVGVYFLINALGVVEPPMPKQVAVWSAVMFAGIGLAVVNLWSSRWWRKVIAAVGVVVFVLTGGLGINAVFGLTPTVGSVFGIVVQKPIDVGTSGGTSAELTVPLYKSWKPPADLPEKGKQGTVVIPDSHFDARPAGIYLPPAALVKNPPALPLVILMMGYPGTPDPQYVGSVLDQYAAQHHGLAPIVVVADQIGQKGDPACADSATFGDAETYITKDVVDWAKAHLHILTNPKYWTIAGYSNGGACSFKYAAKYPNLWHNLIAISPDEWPGIEIQSQTIAQVFGGDQAAFEAAKPTSILAAHPGRYGDITAVFTVGGSDTFLPGVQRDATAAKQAGMKTTFYVVPGAGHVGPALTGGLDKAFGVLYPVLGLSAP